MRDTISMVCEITPKNYYNWKNKSHKTLISLLEKYFTKEDLQDFLNSGKIQKFEKFLQIEDTIFQKNRIKFLNTFIYKTDNNTLLQCSNIFIDFYFSFLLKIKKDGYLTGTNTTHIVNNFLIDYAISNIDNIDTVKTINKDIHLFQNWDELMFIFLKEAIDINFKNLYYVYEDTKLKKEAIFQIIGLHVYNFDTDFSKNFKVELIIKLFEYIIGQEDLDKLSYELLIDKIVKIKKDMIDLIQELYTL